MVTPPQCWDAERGSQVAVSPPLARCAGPLSAELGIDVDVATFPRGFDVFVVPITDVEVLAALRQTEPATLLLVVNDRGPEVGAGDIAHLFDEGADAFLNTFRMQEVAAQVRALLRRRRWSGGA